MEPMEEVGFYEKELDGFIRNERNSKMNRPSYMMKKFD
jgi:hypothetical protein